MTTTSLVIAKLSQANELYNYYSRMFVPKGHPTKLLKRFAASFGIVLLGFAILSSHFHLILRSRPDVVATWDDDEIARRWLMLCPVLKTVDGLKFGGG